MLRKEFIFSEKRSDRIKRHLVFWFSFLLLNVLINSLTTTRHDMSFYSSISITIYRTFQDIVPQILLTYALIGFVLPKYLLKNRYFISICLFVLFVYATGAFQFVFMNYLSWLPPLFPPTGSIWLDFLLNAKGALVAAAVACSIKLLKYWHFKEKRNLELQKEKSEAQLQLLTAHVHPRFLFNTLKNIQSKAQIESPGSAKMITGLSHILRYVLEEGKHELVPLENELLMLTDFIQLEKMRYDDKLDLHLSLPPEPQTTDFYITPLLLLPFVENCFKHGTSKMINYPWINLRIELEGTSLVMKLMNGKKTSLATHNGRKGTGITNVKKRLDLLYKDNYDLQIINDPEVFVVNLRLKLVKNVSTNTQLAVHHITEHA